MEGVQSAIYKVGCPEAKTNGLVNIVFSFDTTGSMSPIIESVRKNLKDTIERLYQEVPGIHIGMIAHGDYCDYRRGIFVWVLDPTDDLETIYHFLSAAQKTGGGDRPECYELALQQANQMRWTSQVRVLVMIGDENPHEPGYELPIFVPEIVSPLEIDWRKEMNQLVQQKVAIFGCHALANRNSSSVSFYQTLAAASGGLYITMDELGSFPEFMVGICLKAVDGAEDYQLLLHRQQELIDQKKKAKSREEHEAIETELKETTFAIHSTEDGGSVFSPQIRQQAQRLRFGSDEHTTRSERYKKELSAKKKSISKDVEQFLNLMTQ